MTVIVAAVRSSTSAAESSVAFTRLQITHSVSSRSPSALDTYVDRQSAQSRSRVTARLPVLEHFGCQPLHERVDAHIAFGPLAPPLVDADGAVVGVGVADDEDVRDLLGLGPADAVPELTRGTVDQLRAEAL